MKLSEFRWAQESIDIMANTENLDEYEKHWTIFLELYARILNIIKNIEAPEQRVARETVRGLQKEREEVLCYLLHARNADGHTFTNITQKIGGSTIIRGPVTIPKGTTIVGGSIPSGLSPDVAKAFSVTPDTLEVIPVIDHKEPYAPPTKHLGTSISTKRPHELAKIGLDYYKAIFPDSAT